MKPIKKTMWNALQLCLGRPGRYMKEDSCGIKREETQFINACPVILGIGTKDGIQ
jgi:hypothetical protein